METEEEWTRKVAITMHTSFVPNRYLRYRGRRRTLKNDKYHAWHKWNRCVVIMWRDAIAYAYCNLNRRFQTIDRVITHHENLQHSHPKRHWLDITNYLLEDTFESKFIEFIDFFDARNAQFRDNYNTLIFELELYTEYSEDGCQVDPISQNLFMTYLGVKYSGTKIHLYV